MNTKELLKVAEERLEALERADEGAWAAQAEALHVIALTLLAISKYIADKEPPAINLGGEGHPATLAEIPIPLPNPMKYPIRCEIVDVDGTGERVGPYLAKTPDVSKPHIGKRGLAERMEDGNVRITLDDGSVIYGYECWWEALGDE